jgi:hypothetical protein
MCFTRFFHFIVLDSIIFTNYEICSFLLVSVLLLAYGRDPNYEITKAVVN